MGISCLHLLFPSKILREAKKKKMLTLHTHTQLRMLKHIRIEFEFATHSCVRLAYAVVIQQKIWCFFLVFSKQAYIALLPWKHIPKYFVWYTFFLFLSVKWSCVQLKSKHSFIFSYNFYSSFVSSPRRSIQVHTR